MKRAQSITAIAFTGLMALSVLSAPIAATASEEGKRNTTYALGAAAAALLLTQKNKLPGILAAGGAAYAYSQIHNDDRSRDRRDRDRYSNENGRDRRHDADRNSQDGGYRYSENGGERDHANGSGDRH